MKHYITYSEALDCFDDEAIDDAYRGSWDKESLLTSYLRTNLLFTILSEGNILIQKESLFSYPLANRYLKHEYKDGYIVQTRFVSNFISTLNFKLFNFEGGVPGIPIIEDIVCDYIFVFDEFEESLKKEGLYGMLRCPYCMEIYCTEGLFVEVRHLTEDIVGWPVASFQEEYPRSYMRGFLFDESDYLDYLAIPEMDFDWCESKEINRLVEEARRVAIQLPLVFERKQLEELVSTYA